MTLTNEVCKCGILFEICKNQFFPVIKESTQIKLVFSDVRKESIKFCFFCGGNDLGPTTKSTYKCECKMIDNWSNEKNSPIKFDAKFHEYYIEGKDGSTRVFYFCISCGGRLSESKREDFFTKMSGNEIKKISNKIKDIKTVAGIIRKLGEPNKEKLQHIENEYKEDDDTLHNISRTLVYESLGKTVNLFVQESEDGEIIYFFTGKLII